MNGEPASFADLRIATGDFAANMLRVSAGGKTSMAGSRFA